MPLIIGDLFSAFSREHRLPGCAVSFVTNAGSWSALNSRSGFVPSTMLADFTDDPDQAVRTLCAAGVIERARGGVRFAEDCPVVTVVNAADAEQEAAEQRAAEDAERSAKSAGGKRGNHERWHEKQGKFSPGCEFCQASAPQKPAETKRTSHSDRIRSVSDSDATPIDRSKSDPDLSIVRPEQQPQLDAHARKAKPGSPEFRLHVIAAFAEATSERTGTAIEIGTEIADAIASEVLGGREGVGRRLPYVLAAIKQEKDPLGRWFPGYKPPAADKSAALEWCGQCDPNDRTRENEHGQVYACPECSPKSFAAWEATA